MFLVYMALIAAEVLWVDVEGQGPNIFLFSSLEHVSGLSYRCRFFDIPLLFAFSN